MNEVRTWTPRHSPGWLSGSRVRHRVTGALGIVVDPNWGVPHRWPLVMWDHGATIRHDARDLERSPDDWFVRAAKGTS